MNLRRLPLLAVALLFFWFFALHVCGLGAGLALLTAILVLLAAGYFLRRRWHLPLLEAVFKSINCLLPWHKLPTRPAIANLLTIANLDALRYTLRLNNLHDTPARDMPPLDPVANHAVSRTADGSYNDLKRPNMGRAGMRFARNVPLEQAYPDLDRLMHPNPRTISLRLMTRETFAPAKSLNLLAASWIQFQAHGWVNHERQDEHAWEVPLADDDPWPERPMRIFKTPQDSEATDQTPPTYVNTESHWWDQSQIYASDAARQRALRTGQGGKLRTETVEIGGLEERRLPPNPDPRFEGIDQTGFDDNYWSGLSMLHTLFTLEHNAIADRLARDYPAWDDDRLFAVARLVNCALIAKIHTVEWTPGILGHPALQIGMRANWWGLLGEQYKRALGRLGRHEELSGIIGSETDHHSGDYALTEEFTAVYRLHTLIPEEIRVWSLADDRETKRASFTDTQGNATRPFMRDVSMADLFYSFGIVHPGAIRLHNFPRVLQNLKRIDDTILDLAALDILRDRERGVPRYNQFRRLLHMKPAKTFSDITSNRTWARELEEVYEGELELVDLQIGAAAEDLPAGFGFSDTIFRIFILMASRRLKSDRFFTNDYTADVYTQVGLDWIDANGLADVLRRHYPELAPALHGVSNPFAPWKPTPSTDGSARPPGV